MIRVTVWNEYLHEKEEPVRHIYPNGVHGCIKEFLQTDEELAIKTATFEMPEHGLTDEVLAQTDVLIFWSHMRQNEFSDEVAARVCSHVRQGMGLVALHSAHFSKIMKGLLGTSMTLRWKHGESERVFCTAPYHPIAEGIPERFDIPKEEMYGEYFDIPKPDDVIFTGWFSCGEVFRSGCTFHSGYGKIFYFQPGHEEYPVYYIPEVQKIIKNAVHWCKPSVRKTSPLDCAEVKEVTLP